MTPRPHPYDTLIDDETWAFIDRTNSFYPPDTATRSVAEQRQIYDSMCREFFAGYPDGVTVEDLAVNGVPCRGYTKGDPQALVLYFHGGGFVVGGLDSHDDVCAEICDLTGHRVVSADYRMSPEHPHPAAFLDCLSVFEWAAEQGPPVVLVGDSAGGNLVAAVSHATRDHAKPPVGQVQFYPGLGGDLDKGSYITHANAPMLTRDDLIFYKGVRAMGRDVTGDITFAPLWDDDFFGLPPTIVVSAECDPLSDDGEVYRDHILGAGGKAVWFNEAGMVHGFLRARHTSRRARESFTRIAAAIGALGRGEWPY